MDNNTIDQKDILNFLVFLAIGVLVGVAFIIVCVSCSVQKPTVVYRDSVRVEYRDREVHDTAYFEVPIEIEKIVTRDTASCLENKWARSEASVSGGFLSHSLATKPQTVPVPVTVHVTDTLIVEKEAQEVEVVKEVEKPLTWWQNFRLKGFWWLLAGLVGCIVWIFRKPILSFIKTIL